MRVYRTGGVLGARLARSGRLVRDGAGRCPRTVSTNFAHHVQAPITTAALTTCAPAGSYTGSATTWHGDRPSAARPLARAGLLSIPPGALGRSSWRVATRLPGLLLPARLAANGRDDAATAPSTAAPTPGPSDSSAAATTPTAPTYEPLPLSPSVGGTPVRPGSGYKLPPPEIAAIVDAPAQPSLSYSPDRKTFLQLTRPPSLPPIYDMSRPELKLAGLRIDPDLYARSKMSYYTDISVVPATEVVPAPPDRCRRVTGYPAGSWINYVSWSPDGTHIAFTIRSPGGPGDPPRGPLELWIADPTSGTCRPLLRRPSPHPAPAPSSPPTPPPTPPPSPTGSPQPPQPQQQQQQPSSQQSNDSQQSCAYRGLNTVFEDYAWLDDTTLVAAVLPEGLGAPPARPPLPGGPKISDNTAGKKAQNRTWPDLLKDDHDMALFEHYGVSELLAVDVRSGEAAAIGPPRMYIDVDPSPDGRYLLVTWLEPPYSTAVPCGRFPRRTQLWRRDGSLVRELAALPLAEDIPIAFNSCRPGPRGINWRDDAPAEVYWIEARDGGDPGVDVSPRDVVYALRAEEAEGDPRVLPPRTLAATDLRCGGVAWCDGGLAILFESWYKSRRSVWWRFAPDRPEEPKEVIFDRNYEDVYGDPGSPLTRRTQWGTYTVARITPDDVTLAAVRQAAATAAAAAEQQQQQASGPSVPSSASSPGSTSSSSTTSGNSSKAPVTMAGLASGSGTWLLMSGSGASPEGNRPFLDLFHLESGETHRLWQSRPPFFESVGSLMSDTDPHAPITVEAMSLMMSRESASDPPQTFLTTFRFPSPTPSSSTPSSSTSTPTPTPTPVLEERRVTNFPHPHPQLRDLRREVLRYPRGSDGVMLTATLYLPPGYDTATHGPLPCIVWAYPREYKTKEAAGQMRRSPHQFASIGSTSPTLWLARGYAVLDGPTLPIVADVQEGDSATSSTTSSTTSTTPDKDNKDNKDKATRPAAEPNDTFLEQLTDGARAAVSEVVRRGVADPARISVGGHSYGAFMTANLIAHAPDLFAAGIARTGAYNRTLTPFGFQNEERTLWQAPEVYGRMSPFMAADKVSKPLLLIHGEDDNNPGTFPLQSERFYQALKGHGATCRLVLLPYESHSYRAHESVMHTLYEQDQWIERYAGYGRLDPGYMTEDTGGVGTGEGTASE